MTTDIASPPTLPAHYRMEELDGASDRAAMIDLDEWAFAYTTPPEDEAELVWALEDGRILGVWHESPSGERVLAAMHASYAFRMQVPGGGTVPTSGLTWVGVHPAHRRRGLARAMVRTHLERSLARGEVVSALTAAETGIYGRYGYGMATQYTTLTLGRGAALRPVPGAESLTVEIADADRTRHEGLVHAVHRAVRRPGWITRDTPALRRQLLADLPSQRRGAERLRVAVVRDAAGTPRGYAVFRRRLTWSPAKVPDGVVEVRESLCLDPAAERALWGTLTDLDLMATVRTGHLPVDAPLLHLLRDLRPTEQRLHDDVWVRLLDVPGALAARAYQAPVDVVLEVRDELLPANAGRWHVRGGGDGAEVTRTRAEADLVLDVAELGRAYLGGASLTSLARAGLVQERRPGALAPVATAFGWPEAPANVWPF